MIVRVVDGIVYTIPDVSPADEDRFMEKNPTGGFMKVDSLPESKHGNLKFVDGEIVVDAEREAAREAMQYQYDRSGKYPSIEEQLDMMYWDKVNGTDTWVAAISKVKQDTPKPVS